MGSSDSGSQTGANCAGRCEYGYIEPVLGGTDQCLHCPPGHWCHIGQANPCPIGTYAKGLPEARQNLAACMACPEHATTHDHGAVDIVGCVCEKGFIADSLAATLTCLPCPPNALCGGLNTTSANIALELDHWRPSQQTIHPQPCPRRGLCANGVNGSTVGTTYDRFSDATCAPGRGVAGAYCLLCMEPSTHYFSAAANECQPCTDTDTVFGVVTLCAAVVLIIGAVLLTHHWFVQPQLGSMAQRIRTYAARISLRAKLRILISFAQIVSQLESVYDLRYPHEFRTLIGALSIVNIDLSWLPGLQLHCLGVRSLTSRLLVMTLAPLGIAFLVPLITLARRRPLASCLPLVLSWIFLLFPAVSSFGFRALAPCDCFMFVGGGHICFLREDYEVECTGTLFGRAAAPPDVLAAAWLAVFLWAVGVPVGYLILLFASAHGTRVGSSAGTRANQEISGLALGARWADRFANALRARSSRFFRARSVAGATNCDSSPSRRSSAGGGGRRTQLRLALGILVGDYRGSMRGWELVILGEKLALTGVPAIFDPGSWTQLFMGTAIALLAFGLQARVMPYHSADDNFFAFLASLSLVAVFQGSLGLQTQSLGLNIDSTLIVTILFAFTLLVLLTALAFFILELRSSREIIVVHSTGHPPCLVLPDTKRWHLFLSHW